MEPYIYYLYYFLYLLKNQKSDLLIDPLERGFTLGIGRLQDSGASLARICTPMPCVAVQVVVFNIGSPSVGISFPGGGNGDVVSLLPQLELPLRGWDAVLAPLNNAAGSPYIPICLGLWPGMQIPHANSIALFWIYQKCIELSRVTPSVDISTRLHSLHQGTRVKPVTEMFSKMLIVQVRHYLIKHALICKNFQNKNLNNG